MILVLCRCAPATPAVTHIGPYEAEVTQAISFIYPATEHGGVDFAPVRLNNVTIQTDRLPRSPRPAADEVLMAITSYLGHCRLAAKTVKAYERHCRAYVGWLSQHTDEHPTAFANIADAEAAVIAWRRHLIGNRYSPANINQALAGVTLLTIKEFPT